MTVRVNLLKESEYRYQGAVSSVFIVRTSMATIVAFVAVFGFLGAFRYRINRQELAAYREIWAMREPLYNQVLAMKQDLAVFKKQQQELGGWTASRVNWQWPLLEVQAILPPTVQMRRLNVRGEIDMVRRASAPVDSESEGGPPPAQAGPLPSRQYFISLDGKASGKMAENVVVQFVRTLGNASTLKPLLQSIKLQSLQRDTSVGGQASRTFTIEATSKRREMIIVTAPGGGAGGTP